MGAVDRSAERPWTDDPRVIREIRWTHAVPSGRRFGRRFLGIGLDSFILAAMTRLSRARGPFICANPWTAVALRMFGISNFAVTGIYALPETMSWRLLRFAIGRRPVVTLLDTESEEWNSSGGIAAPVRYGNTFGYPLATPRQSPEQPVRVFVGGTSDRDPKLINELISDLGKASENRYEVIVADGTGPRTKIVNQCRVKWQPVLPPSEFGRVLASCDVVFLPLSDKKRAAGHMVMVGSLEAGLRVLTPAVRGISGYVDGYFVVELDPTQRLCTQIDALARLATEAVPAVRAYWLENFSIHAYINRVLDSLCELTAVGLKTAD